MDLNLTEDQRALQIGLRNFLKSVYNADRMRELADHEIAESAGMPAGVERDWRSLAELGVFAVGAPESVGGMGLGMADSVILAEELGAALVPGPLVPSLLAAGHIDGVLEGESVVATLDLRSPVLVVENLDRATHVVIVDDDGLHVVAPEALSATRLSRPLDPLTPMSAVVVDPGALASGERIGGPAEALDWTRKGEVLTAALQIGVARGALDLAVRYAGERSQFGRVIGGFQAIKHLLAESLARVTIARPTVLVAALSIDDPEVGSAGVDVSAARIIAGEAAGLNGRCCVQVHGGMGFTWEVLAHLYLKRAWLLETSFGSVGSHCDKLARTI
ncbi:acyl-CoA dehydrogenase family protein [Rhodococcus sp. IEGM 1366]|uniref:acyl-CoA dehydrogenase family protein n=1 Tax=Rhodococcus sp. IEGM 1366 TaxID=3082223 RepID=UPI002952B25F|nr:acyl-CoA dehydrogenase family protein [Rhodococcus sp. IEGM 1366]MDV8071029.1 acyl-CoA dehydrogenase family protein [Rhodococcus sp. IEGM 1366]